MVGPLPVGIPQLVATGLRVLERKDRTLWAFIGVAALLAVPVGLVGALLRDGACPRFGT